MPSRPRRYSQVGYFAAGLFIVYNEFMNIFFLNIKEYFLRYLNISLAFLIILSLSISGTVVVLASATSSFTQVINPGTLSVDIVNASYASVESPSVALGAATFSFSCQTSTGTFGTNTERIYITNPDAADSGWAVSLAAASPTSTWVGTGSTFDFNDPTTSGCTDSGSDSDSVGGQMTVNPASSTLAVGNCASCSTSNVSLGSQSAFSEVAPVVNSITILTGAANSDDIGDWRLTGVSISQKIPAEQKAASDYTLSLTLSIVAS